MYRFSHCKTALLLIALCSNAMGQVRIKDLTDISGASGDSLSGIGLVVGLNGTGSKSGLALRAAQSMLSREELDATLSEINLKNAAIVVVRGELPAFARYGSTIDVHVGTIDDASSLQGGILMRTALKSLDDEVYAIAEGPVSIGGFSFGGAAASVQKNHPTSGKAKARVYRPSPAKYEHNGMMRLLLRKPDFTTADAITKIINQRFPNTARAPDSGTIDILIPPGFTQSLPSFVSKIESLKVKPDYKAQVVINERTGTVVAGLHVRIETVAISHGNLSVSTAESPQVSQPLPFSEGQTAIVPRSEISVSEDEGELSILEAVTVSDLAEALNQLGATPRDLSAVFQTLETKGAIHAEVILD